jgi:hypothetical protein
VSPKETGCKRMPVPEWIIHTAVLGGLFAAAMLIVFRVI